MTINKLDSIREKINRAILEYNMLDDVKTLIVGVSGGADSMALLKFLEDYANKNRLNLIVSHVNHCLRGEESDRDEVFVREYCKKNNIEFELLKLDVKKIAQKNGQSIEECARELRYNFLNELSTKYNGKIATAHTLSDSIETVLINLVRGTGPAGLCGISAKRDNIIRPLIFLKRSDTQFFCKENGISYVTDSTNLSRDYTRNKIRLDIIPALKLINSNFEVTVARTASLLKADDKYLKDIAKRHFEKSKISHGIYDLSDVKALPQPILSRFVRIAVFDFLKSNLTEKHVYLILDFIKNNNGAINLPKNIKLSVKNNLMIVENIIKNSSFLNQNFEVAFKTGSLLTEYSEEFIIKVMNKAEFENFSKTCNLLFFYALDYDTITLDTVFRNRRAGDKFCKASRGVTKSVKKLFNELKIPQEKRDKIIMLASKNQILWINNIGVSEQAKVTKTTKKFAVIYLKDKNIC